MPGAFGREEVGMARTHLLARRIVAIVFVLAVVFVASPPHRAAAASRLVLQNRVLVFPDPGAVVFTVSGTAETVSWSVGDADGDVVAAGVEETHGRFAKIAIGRKLPTGFYTFSFRSSSDDEVTAAFGVTGPAPSDDPYFSVQTLSAHADGVYRRNMNRITPMLKDLGFSSRRDSVYWSEYEESKGVYATPSSLEKVLDDDEDVGMSLLWTAGSGNPLYDDGKLPSSPAAIQAYADYIDAFLTQHPHVRRVEMFNEFNATNDSACGATASCYLEIARTVYPLVKSRHPDVTVVAGGVAAVSLDWWRQFFSAGGAAYGDAFSYHPYNLSPERLNETAAEMTSLIKKANGGVGKPLYLSEIGWSISDESSGNPAKVATEAGQADRLVYSFVAPRASPQIALVNWYQAIDSGSTQTEYNFGLFRDTTANVAGYQPKRSAIAFYVMRSELDGFHYLRTDSVAVNVVSYVFGDGEGNIRQVVWRTDDVRSSGSAPIAVRIPTSGEKYASVVDINGDRIASTNDGGRGIDQTLSSSPLFIESSDSPLPTAQPVSVLRSASPTVAPEAGRSVQPSDVAKVLLLLGGFAIVAGLSFATVRLVRRSSRGTRGR